MLDSLRTMFWITVLLLITIYCLAIVLTTYVGQSDYVNDHWLNAPLYVGTVWRSMWTMIEIITSDCWEDVSRPILEYSPTAVYLCVFLPMLLCTFGVLNIIIAVMVERIQVITKGNATQTGKILEKTEHKLLESMAMDFQGADMDNNGELEFDEFKRMIYSDSMSYKLRLLGVMCDEAESLFGIMDADKSGSVSPEEFVTGLTKLKGIAKGQDLVQLICFAQKQCFKATGFVETLRRMNIKCDEIQERILMVGKGMTQELRLRRYNKKRTEEVQVQAAKLQREIGGMDKHRNMQFPSLVQH